MKHREDFTNFEYGSYDPGASAVEGAGSFKILGKGTAVKLFRVKGKLIRITFKNALLAPSLAANLISISALDKAGFFTTFGGNAAVVKRKDGTELFHGRGRDGMYVLDAEEAPGQTSGPRHHVALSSRSSPTDIEQWHRRFVHASTETIERMERENMVDGLKGAVTSHKLEGKCESCILARQTRRPSDVPTDPDVEPLDLVSVDLWGPSRTRSSGGKVYLMPIVD
ncbi:hypothetical protein GG344DRAFT_58400, partial [Lentinula edodes]